MGGASGPENKGAVKMKFSEILVNGRNHRLVCEIDGGNFGEFYIIENLQGNMLCNFNNCEVALNRFYELETV